MANLLYIFVDDEPGDVIAQYINDLMSLDGNAEMLCLTPTKPDNEIINTLLELGIKVLYDSERNNDNYSVKDFVTWCVNAIKTDMYRTVVIFCDYQLNKLSAQYKHWEYMEGGRDLEGMFDLRNKLLTYNLETQWVSLTNHPKSLENKGFIVHTKGATLNTAAYIKDAANRIRSRISYEHKFAWLDRQIFLINHDEETLKHCSCDPNKASIACNICEKYLKETVNASKANYELICQLFPYCITEKCDHITHDKQIIWRSFYKEFILFMNPDWSILYSILFTREPYYNKVKRFNNIQCPTGYEQETLFEAADRGGYLELSALPNEIKVETATKAISMYIDSTLLQTEVGRRTDNTIVGRHYHQDNDKYCCIFPWDANKIGQIIYDNLVSVRHNNRGLIIKSEIDDTSNIYIIYFDHICKTDELRENVKIRNLDVIAKFGASYEAYYLRNDIRDISDDYNAIFRIKIKLPLREYGDSENSPWRP